MMDMNTITIVRIQVMCGAKVKFTLCVLKCLNKRNWRKNTADKCFYFVVKVNSTFVLSIQI